MTISNMNTSVNNPLFNFNHAILETYLKQNVIGQDKAIETIVNKLLIARVGLNSVDSPIGSFLFYGQTGLGKTHTAKMLAKSFTGDIRSLISIDCTELSSDHEVSKLTGAPPGYIGHENGSCLTKTIKESPFSIVLFDEVEKASPAVHNLMLEILDEGRLTDGTGETVSFKNTIIIMTSNIGVDKVNSIRKTIGFGDVSKVTDAKKLDAYDTALKSKFKPEFLNRIDEKIEFRQFEKSDYMTIIDLELQYLKNNLVQNKTEYSNLSFHFDEKVKALIYKNGIYHEYGARPIKRCISNKVSTPVAAFIVNSNIPLSSVINVSANQESVNISFYTPVHTNNSVIQNTPLSFEHPSVQQPYNQVYPLIPPPGSQVEHNTNNPYIYHNHCWNCKGPIDSTKCNRDPEPQYGYICNQCGESLRGYRNKVIY